MDPQQPSSGAEKDLRKPMSKKRKEIIQGIRGIQPVAGKNLRDVEVPKELYTSARAVAEEESVDIRFCKVPVYDLLLNHVRGKQGSPDPSQVEATLAGWKQASKALFRYALNLVLAPKRPEYKKMKLSSSFYVYNISRNLQRAEQVFIAMGYQVVERQGRGGQDLVYEGDVKLAPVLETATDLLVMHEEVGLIRELVAGGRGGHMTLEQAIIQRWHTNPAHGTNTAHDTRPAGVHPQLPAQPLAQPQAQPQLRYPLSTQGGGTEGSYFLSNDMRGSGSIPPQPHSQTYGQPPQPVQSQPPTAPDHHGMGGYERGVYAPLPLDPSVSSAQQQQPPVPFYLDREKLHNVAKAARQNITVTQEVRKLFQQYPHLAGLPPQQKNTRLPALDDDTLDIYGDDSKPVPVDTQPPPVKSQSVLPAQEALYSFKLGDLPAPVVHYRQGQSPSTDSSIDLYGSAHNETIQCHLSRGRSTSTDSSIDLYTSGSGDKLGKYALQPIHGEPPSDPAPTHFSPLPSSTAHPLEMNTQQRPALQVQDSQEDTPFPTGGDREIVKKPVPTPRGLKQQIKSRSLDEMEPDGEGRSIKYHAMRPSASGSDLLQYERHSQSSEPSSPRRLDPPIPRPRRSRSLSSRSSAENSPSTSPTPPRRKVPPIPPPIPRPRRSRSPSPLSSAGNSPPTSPTPLRRKVLPIPEHPSQPPGHQLAVGMPPKAQSVDTETQRREEIREKNPVDRFPSGDLKAAASAFAQTSQAISDQSDLDQHRPNRHSRESLAKNHGQDKSNLQKRSNAISEPSHAHPKSTELNSSAEDEGGSTSATAATDLEEQFQFSLGDTWVCSYCTNLVITTEQTCNVCGRKKLGTVV